MNKALKISGVCLVLALLFFGVYTALHHNQPITNSQPIISSLEEYDSYLGSRCKNLEAEFFATCAYSIVLNDEKAEGSIRTYAQQEQMAINGQQVLKKTDSELKSEITSGLTALNNKYSTELGLQMSVDLAEFVNHRHLTDSGINDLASSVFTKYGPCWGIPEGQCKE